MNTRQPVFAIPLWVAVIYMFFNMWLLPGGLFYTTLLAPLFFYNGWKAGVVKPYLCYLSVSLIYLIWQWPLIVSSTDYARSWVLTLLNIPFLVNAWIWLRNSSSGDIHHVFKKLLYINFLLLLVALLTYWILPLRPVFWYLIPITEGSGIIPRLKMLTSEASVYSLLMSPLVLYFFFDDFLQQRQRLSLAFILLIVLPMALSFSMGVFACLFLAILFTVLRFHRYFRQHTGMLRIIGWAAAGVCVVLLLLYCFNKDNVLFLRLQNIFSGKDTSARGRTYEAFEIAVRVLKESGAWWTGIGPGQFKLIGREALLSYYQYSGNVPVIRIPNAAADTLVVYGLSGLLLRLALQVFFFFRTGVYNNIFRFALFVFLFIYQFTGSYYNNLLELTLWMLIFTKAFSQFNKDSLPNHALRFPATT